MPNALPFITVTTSLFVIVFLGRWLVGGTLERRFARKHGFSRDIPACAQCYYLTEGWTSPVCPECGADARDTGLRIGPRSKAMFVDGLAVAILVAFVIPLAILAARWVAHGETIKSNLTISNQQLDAVDIELQQTTISARFPEQSETTSVIIFSNRSTLQNSEPIPIAQPDDLVNDTVRRTLSAIAEIPEADVDRQLQDIASVLEDALFLDNQLRPELSPTEFQIRWPYSVSGGGYSFIPLKRTPIAIGATVIITLTVGLLLVRRIVKNITDGYAYPASDDPHWEID